MQSKRELKGNSCRVSEQNFLKKEIKDGVPCDFKGLKKPELHGTLSFQESEAEIGINR